MQHVIEVVPAIEPLNTVITPSTPYLVLYTRVVTAMLLPSAGC